MTSRHWSFFETPVAEYPSQPDMASAPWVSLAHDAAWQAGKQEGFQQSRELSA